MKGYLYKFLGIILICLLVLGGYCGYLYCEVTASRETGEKQAEVQQLPTVQVPMGMMGADWRGYAQEMDITTMRDGILPLSDRTMPILVTGGEITQIRWQIRNLDGTRLIHQESVTNWKDDGEKKEFTLQLPVLLEEGKEYLIRLELELADSVSVYYYNRFVIRPETPYEEQIVFVRHIHEASLGLDDSSDLTEYLDVSSDAANDNLGYVTKGATKDQFMWGALAPERITDAFLTVVDFNDAYLGTYRLDYTVRASEEEGVVSYYDVREYYRVRLDEDGFTLVDYVRCVWEQFVPEAATVTAGAIRLGVQPSGEVNYVTNEDRDAVMLEISGDLWYRNAWSGEMTALCLYKTRDYRHGYKLLSMDKDGNCDYIIYGSMPEGQHYGMSGISLCRYTAKTGKNEELMFLQSDKSYDFLREGIETIAYVNSDGVLYLMLNHCLYSINDSSHESVIIAENLRDYNFTMDSGKRVAAWNVGGKNHNAEVIRLVNLETGANKVLRGPEGTYVKAIGFVGDDFVYAVIDRENLLTDWVGETCYGASHLVIVNEKMETAREYSVEGCYFTDISLNGGMLTLQCSKKQADGSFVYSHDDYIVNQHTTEAYELSVSSGQSLIAQKEWSLAFSSVTAEGKEKRTAQIEWKPSGRVLSGIVDEDLFYVYGERGYAGCFERLGDAVNVAYDKQGYVIDSKGTYLFKRKTTQNWRRLTGMTVEELQSFLRQYESGVGKNISGALLDRALSFLGSGEYWLYAGVDEEWVFITEFDQNYVVYMDVETGKRTTELREDMEKIMEKNGRHYFIVPR